MVRTVNVSGVTKSIVNLSVSPKVYQISPNIIGQGSAMYGFHRIEYEMPNGDCLRFIADDKVSKRVKIQLETKDCELIKSLPSKRATSLVTNVLSQLNDYQIRLQRYGTLTPLQSQKKTILDELQENLKPLLGRERALIESDITGQELLRNDIIELIERARDANRQACDSLSRSEGQLGKLFYETGQDYTKHYNFNQTIRIDKKDQLNFSTIKTSHLEIENSELRQLIDTHLAPTNKKLSNQSIQCINEYFASDSVFPPYNKSALDHLFSYDSGFYSHQHSPVFDRQSKNVFLKSLGQHYDKIRVKHVKDSSTKAANTILWDSHFHVGDDKEKLDETLITLCNYYQLSIPSQLNHLQGNRLRQFNQFFHDLWKNAQEAADYYALKSKPNHTITETTRDDGLFIQKIQPYYVFDGKVQKTFKTKQQLLDYYHPHCKTLSEEINSLENAIALCENADNLIIKIADKNYFLVKENSVFTVLHFAKDKDGYLALPSGDDLYEITQLARKHLYWPIRASLRARAFLAQIPTTIKHMFKNLGEFISVTLPKIFFEHIHMGHVEKSKLRSYYHQQNLVFSLKEVELFNASLNNINIDSALEHFRQTKCASFEVLEQCISSQLSSCLVQFPLNDEQQKMIKDFKKGPLKNFYQQKLNEYQTKIHLISNAHQNMASIEEILHEKGFLSNGKTVDDFIKQHLGDANITIAEPTHRPDDFVFNDPLNRTFRILRHFADFFVNYSEKNPLVGTLAMAAYIYGGAAVVAPKTLAAVLSKLHLHGLIKLIKPTQELGKLMSHGVTSEAISAGITYWQAIVISGDFDKFFVAAIEILKEDPVKVAVLTSATMGLGYTLCKVFPPLGNEMGKLPYTNYLALGAKSGAAIYDTVTNPGDDVILGTLKWILRSIALVGQFFIGPCVEWYYYGFKHGFVFGCGKNLELAKIKGLHFIASIGNFLLSVAAVPFSEIASMLIHVPFRGITKLITKTLATLGKLDELGSQLLNFALRRGSWNYFEGFRKSPLYGFNHPLDNVAKDANLLTKIAAFAFFPVIQTIKNVLLLPFVDVISLTVRGLLTFIINPFSRMSMSVIGGALKMIGFVTDPTIGSLLVKSANLITKCADAVDGFFGKLKRSILSGLNYAKIKLRLFAYSDLQPQEKSQGPIMPVQYEQFHPHGQSACLINQMLGTSNTAKDDSFEPVEKMSATDVNHDLSKHTSYDITYPQARLTSP
jgi:hypothetical protein